MKQTKEQKLIKQAKKIIIKRLEHWNPFDVEDTTNIYVLMMELGGFGTTDNHLNPNYSTELDKMIQTYYNIKWEEKDNADVKAFLKTLENIKDWDVWNE